MKRKFTLFGMTWLFIGLMSFSGFSQVQVGTGTNETQSLPIDPYYGYSYTQVIYLDTEINASGDITDLQWYFSGTSLSNSNDWTIYIGHTTKPSFSSTTDWVAVGDMTQVYSGTFANPGAPGWITFDITDFAYNGTDNLVVAVDENAPSCNTSSDDFHCTSVTDDRGIYYRSDGTNPDPANPPSAGGTPSYIANIIFGGIVQTCPAPTGLVVSGETETTADLNWTTASGATGYNWEVVPSGNGQGNGVVSSGSTAGTTAQATGLAASTDYDAYVQNDCGSPYDGPVAFSTLCGTISAFPATEDFENSGSIPNCWTDDPSNTESWKYSTSAGYGATEDHTSGTGYLAWIDDSSPYNANPSNLLSPIYNTTSLTSPQLVFYYWIGRGLTGSTLDIDVYNGTAWQNDVLQLSAQNGWLEATVILTAYSNANLQIRFSGTEDPSSWKCDICIDDVTIREAPACPNPTAQTVANETDSGADLGWTDPTGTHWDLYIVPANDPAPTTGSTPTVDDTQDNPHTWAGGNPTTDYDWYVRSDCGQDNTNVSTWTGASSFTTLQTPAPVQSVPFTEDWETGAIGAAWNYHAGSEATIEVNTASVHGGTYGLEQYGDDGGYTTPSDLADAYAKAQPGGVNEDNTTWNKMSVDLSGTATPWLTFWYAMGYQYNNNYNNFWVQASTDGTTWVDLFSTQTSGSTIAYTEKELDLSAYNGTAQLYVRFFHSGKYDDNYLWLDDISVAEVACPPPTAPTATPAIVSASLAWTQSGTATTWDIEWGATPYTFDGNPDIVGTTTNPHNLTGLTISTEYTWKVRSDCGGSTSSWSDANTFSTTDGKATNPTPADGATDIAANAKIFDWDDVNGATSYTIDIGTATTLSDIVNDGACPASTYTYTGADWDNNEDYFWTVTTIYTAKATVVGDEWDFTTACAVYTPDYYEDFTTFLPDCWDENTGPVTGPTGASGTSAWDADGFANNGTTGSASVNLYTDTRMEWLITPEFDLTGGGYELNFDVAVTAYSGTGPSDMGSDDEVQLLATTDGGTTWTNLATWNTGNTPSNTGDNTTIDISAYTQNPVQFAFWAADGPVNDPEDYNFYVDNFRVQTPPTCPAPTAQTVANETMSGADLGWTDVAGTHWDLYIVPANDPAPTPTSTPTVNDTQTNPYTWADGNQSTDYDWYVRRDCGQDNSDVSTWTGASQFTTTDGKATNPTPADGATGIAANTKIFDWDDVNGATSYTIDIGTATTLSDIVNDGVCPASTYTYTGADWDNNEDYFWTVTTVHGGGTIAGDEWDFTTEYQPATIPWSEGFEGIAGNGSWPGGWHHDGDWNTYTSNQTYNREPHGGDNYAYTKYTADDWAYTCPITMEAGKTYNFSMWYITDGYAGWTTLEAKYGSGQTSGDMTNPICTVSGPTNTTYQELAGSFTPVSDGTYYIGIHVVATGVPYYITIDDLSLAESMPKDISVNSVSIPLPTNVWCHYQSGSYTVSAEIENRGTEADPASVTLTYKEGSEPANEDDGTKQVFAPAWAKGKTATCTFSTQWSPAATGDKTVYVKSFYPGDGNPTNDVASKTVNVKDQYTLLYESFEDTWNSSTPWGPPNWSEATDAAGTTVGNSDWYRSSSYHQDGSYSAYLYFSSSSDDDWLISPVVDLTANTSKGASELSYYIRFGSALTAGDFLYVKISTDGGATWTTIKTYDDSNTSGMTSLTWQGIDLSAYSAQSVKIGFYGDSNANGTCYIYIDAVKVAPASAPIAPTDPSPADAAVDVSIATDLSWSDGGGGTISYDVYFGTDNPPTNIANGTNQSGTNYNPASDLANSTMHYWRIDAVNAQGTTTGDVWSFTTVDPPPSNDDCSGAITVICGEVVSGSTTLATVDLDACTGSNTSAPGVWYHFVGIDDVVEMDLCTGTNYDTKISVFEGSCGSLTCVDDNDDQCGVYSGLAWYSTSGVDYYILVHGYNANTGNFELTVDCVPPATSTWEGDDLTYTDWFNAENWDNGVPRNATDVTIPNGIASNRYPTIDRTAVCNNLTIQSNATGDGSLIENGFLTASGTVTAQRYISNDVWHGVSAPVDGATAQSLYSTTANVYLKYHTESTNDYTYVTSLGTDLEDMKGWMMWYDGTAGETFDITGTLRGSATVGNADNMVRSATDADPDWYGWNFVGNPYTSAIDWDAANGWTKTGLDETIYVYDNSVGGNWSTYNITTGATGNGSRYIALGQAFFVNVSDNGGVGPYPMTGTLTMTNEVQVHNTVGFLKNQDKGVIHERVRLEVSNDTYSDETVICFYEEATREFDSQFDAHKLFSFNNNRPHIYSTANNNMAINTLPIENTEVPVDVSGVDGEDMTISATEIIGFGEVFLYDNYMGIKTNLAKEDYGFMYDEDFADRFLVFFTTVSVPENPDGLFNIYSFENNVRVIVPEETIAEIVIYNLVGQKIIHTDVHKGVNDIPVFETGYYLVKVMDNNTVVTKKVFIK